MSKKEADEEWRSLITTDTSDGDGGADDDRGWPWTCNSDGSVQRGCAHVRGEKEKPLVC